MKSASLTRDSASSSEDLICSCGAVGVSVEVSVTSDRLDEFCMFSFSVPVAAAEAEAELS